MAIVDRPIKRCAAENYTCPVEAGVASCYPAGSPETLAPNVCVQCTEGYGVRYWNGTSMEKNLHSSLYFVTKVQPLTFATRVIAFSVLLQTFLFISLGAVADFGAWRYRLLAVSTVLGGLLTMSVILVTEYRDYQALGMIVLLSNAMWGLANVFYNAYIPVLVDTHEEVIESGNDYAVREEVTSFISSAGSLCGFLSGLTLVIIVLALLYVLPGDDINSKYRLCIFLAGLWWLVWAVWPLARLQTHVELSRMPEPGEIIACSGWASLFRKVKEVRQYPETFKFLLAWFVYSDTFNTVASMGILVLQDRLCMAGADMGLLLIIVLVCAGIGNYGSWSFQQYFRMTTKQMIALCLCVYLLISLLMTIGIADVQVGLKTRAEAYLFAVLHGFALGSIQAYSRSLFADLTVKSKESEWFALYEITDKGSSWLGPLIVGELFNATGDFNIAFSPLLVMCLLSFPLLYIVDHEKGMIASGRQEQEMLRSEAGEVSNGDHKLSPSALGSV
eukprot:Tamp_11486.p1 GENE.Tamp_11486~~Tamp_11486.p1  ORF type:complete len:567 (+),score=61.97 Tamp_11486:193-1701(+)